MILKQTAIAVIASLAFGAGVFAASDEDMKLDKALVKDLPPASLKLAPEKQHKRASQWVAALLNRYHYERPTLDNDMSREMLAQMIKLFDNNRSYFLQKDIDNFEQYKNSLDDAVASGHVDPAFEMFRVFEHRWRERYDYARSLLDEPFDFTVEEDYEFDRQEAAWAADRIELDEIWRKRVKNDALNLVLAGKEWPEVSKTLGKRYAQAKRRMSQTKNEDVFSYMMNAFALAIEPHTSYLSPRSAENFDIDMKLSLEGIGAVLQADDVYTKIVKVVEKGPADMTGEVHEEDKIIGVGQGQGPIEDVIGWRLDDVVDIVRGKSGSTVRLEIIPKGAGADGKSKIVEIVRDRVKLEEQSAKAETLEVTTNDRTYQVGVIELPKFYIDFQARNSGQEDYKSTTTDVRRLIEELQKDGVDGIVLDLRNNGGGALDEAARLTGLFFDEGPVVQGRDFRGKVRVISDPDPETFYSGPLAVLVNSNSASASEILAGAIQDYGRGIIIGEPTFGKGTIQVIDDLNRLEGNRESNFGSLKFTTEKFYRVSGDSTQNKGVVPDINYPSAVNSEEYGESSYDNAMAWDQIRPTQYARLNQINRYLPELTSMHQARIQENSEFGYLLEDIEEYRLAAEDKRISLNLETRKAERAKDEARQLARENARRADKGLKPLDELDEDTETLDAPDIGRLESANILADMIWLQSHAGVAMKDEEKFGVKDK